jgi:integrase
MGRGFDPHNYKGRLKAALRKLKESDISEENKKTIIEFHNYCFAEGLTIPRVAKYVCTLRIISSLLRIDFKDATKADILNLVRKIEQGNYSEWTKQFYKVALKKFYKWLRQTEDYPPEVKWIKTTVKNKKHKLPEELLTEEDVKRLVEAADHPRDRALVFVLYESGCRIGEILALKIKHVSFDKFGAQIIVDGKTGSRRIRLISSTPVLANWLENHPLRDNPNSLLWVGIGTRNKNEPLSYSNVRILLKRLGEKAGIKKAVNPHMFRHSRATFLANHLTEAQMKQYFGWVQGSDMASVYVHLSGRDVDNALLKVYGLRSQEERQESTLKPKDCPRCKRANSAVSKFCNSCGMVLDIKTAIQLEGKRAGADELMTSLVKQPEVQQFLILMIRKLRLDKKLVSI